ncbi:MAG: hypothetical protein AAGI71_08050 [Bacteroidota bacterium]
MPFFCTLSRSWTPGFLVAALLAFTGCGVTNSTVGISGGEQFVLGEGGQRSFRVQVENLGPSPISVGTRTRDGAVTDLTVLQPGEQQRFRIPAGVAALLSNASSVVTQVAVRIRGGGTLGMGYDALE